MKNNVTLVIIISIVLILIVWLQSLFQLAEFRMIKHQLDLVSEHQEIIKHLLPSKTNSDTFLYNN